eukprot:TRINITY_DN801_c0_g1_i4.p1 TRINITY_DN801_c0_g1~~TRINITY_DN801_c0_g1_i4.p1  ORF type:complete len:267 (+),score=158.58 TRINITY_DN801_c0_g1_i4:794-1594(+)
MDAIKKKLDEDYQAVKPLAEESKKLYEEVEQVKKSRQDLTEEAKVEEKKVELISQNIAGIRTKRNELIEKYYKAEDKYMEQQRLIKRIAWMTQQKEWAIKKAERQRQEEEEEKQRKPVHPHAEEIEVCEQLIAYCNRRMGVDKKQEEKKAVVGAAEKTLASGGGKVVLMENKKKKEEELLCIGGTGKKKGKNRNDRKKAKPIEELKLDVDIETLGLFDKVQIQPPYQFKGLAETVKKLEEKKKHFEELPPEPENKEAAEPEPEKTE